MNYELHHFLFYEDSSFISSFDNSPFDYDLQSFSPEINNSLERTISFNEDCEINKQNPSLNSINKEENNISRETRTNTKINYHSKNSIDNIIIKAFGKIIKMAYNDINKKIQSSGKKLIKLSPNEKKFHNKEEKINFLKIKLSDFFSKNLYNKNIIETIEIQEINELLNKTFEQYFEIYCEFQLDKDTNEMKKVFYEQKDNNIHIQKYIDFCKNPMEILNKIKHRKHRYEKKEE